MSFAEKFFLFASTILIGLGLILIFEPLNSGKLRLVFCNVGQGDGMLVISPGGKQVVIDGGRGAKIVDCIGERMPFYDRTIEMVVLTHPQQDHMEGLLEVLARYEVAMVLTTGVKNETQLYREWQKAVEAEGAQVYSARAGDKMVLDQDSVLNVLWPPKERIDSWNQDPPDDLNETSIVMRLEYPSESSGQAFCAYLTGDIPKETLQTLVDTECEVLKISHHGSKTGTNEEIVDKVKPKVAIIQVGKNSYGHPHKEVIDILLSNAVKILRNDINNIIEIQTNGRSFEIKNEKS